MAVLNEYLADAVVDGAVARCWHVYWKGAPTQLFEGVPILLVGGKTDGAYSELRFVGAGAGCAHHQHGPLCARGGCPYTIEQFLRRR